MNSLEFDEIILEDCGITNGVQKYAIVEKETKNQTGYIYQIISKDDQ